MLGYRLVDRLGILEELLPELTTLVGDYFLDGTWYFTSSFFTRHLDIVLDILQTPVQSIDQRIWPSLLDRMLTCRQCYEMLRPSLLCTSWATWI